MGADLDLWDRIDHFDVDRGARAGYFVAKLAYDNGWALAYAARVLTEYRRYAYLACIAEHMVVPSDQVDMAWHQHLLDTEQYWGNFCPSALRRPLQHRPSKAGTPTVVMRDRYRRTLEMYAATFGCAAPPDIWPAPAVRFGAAAHHRRVALADNWIVPKRRVLGVAFAAALPVTVAWSGIPRAAELDVLSGSNTTFFVALGVVAAVTASVTLRRRTFGTAGASESEGVEIDAYDAAALRVNPRLAVNAAMASLVYDDTLTFDAKALAGQRGKYRLHAPGALRPGAHPLERAVRDAVFHSDDGLLLSEVHERVGDQAAELTASLRQRRLVLTVSFARRCLIAAPLVGVAALVVTRALGSPVSELPILVVIACGLVITGLFVASPPRLTPLGEAALDEQRDRRPVDSTATTDDVADGRELAWIIALYGTVAIGGGSLSLIGDAIVAKASKGGGGQAGSSGGGTAGCGAAGCGGCGCGGCG